MHLKLSAFVVLIAASGAASAQTTNCHWVGQTWTCDTQQQTQLDPSIILHANDAFKEMPTYADRVQTQQKIAADEQALAQRRAEIAATKAADALSRQVGKMVSEGNCAGAQSVALSAGDFELADKVKAYCENDRLRSEKR